MPYPTPETVIRQSSDYLFHDFPRVGVFTTAFVGQYVPDSLPLPSSPAGHSPVIFHAFDGEPELRHADSAAVSILPVHHYRIQTLDKVSGAKFQCDSVAMRRGYDEAMLSHPRFIASPPHGKAVLNLVLDMFQIETGCLPQPDSPTTPQSVVCWTGNLSGCRPHCHASLNHAFDGDQTLVVIKGAAL